jgi:hypothetical protein
MLNTKYDKIYACALLQLESLIKILAEMQEMD